MSKRSVPPTWQAGLRPARAVLVLGLLACCVRPALAAESEGRALLEKNCGRCHAIAAGVASPLEQAPNLWDKLRSYPDARLDFELSEGIGSRHETMPQVQFTDEEITAIFTYLNGDGSGPQN